MSTFRTASPAYSAAKGAIAIFTKPAALQYVKLNIHINSVHPGYADPPLTVKRRALFAGQLSTYAVKRPRM
jgi:NAD(P)-dependent dehydrogenase (short-subunit alcohol dehydrogenase family)